MSNEVLVAFITVGGSALGTFAGILTTSKLTNYRIEQLEKKVDKHNGVIERTFDLEGRMREAEHDIRDIKEVKK